MRMTPWPEVLLRLCLFSAFALQTEGIAGTTASDAAFILLHELHQAAGSASQTAA